MNTQSEEREIHRILLRMERHYPPTKTVDQKTKKTVPSLPASEIYEGLPCRNCKSTERYVSTKACRACNLTKKNDPDYTRRCNAARAAKRKKAKEAMAVLKAGITISDT
jgi:uncharacterized paraquat-inducible protein A